MVSLERDIVRPWYTYVQFYCNSFTTSLAWLCPSGRHFWTLCSTIWTELVLLTLGLMESELLLRPCFHSHKTLATGCGILQYMSPSPPPLPFLVKSFLSLSLVRKLSLSSVGNRLLSLVGSTTSDVKPRWPIDVHNTCNITELHDDTLCTTKMLYHCTSHKCMSCSQLVQIESCVFACSQSPT